MEGDSGVIRSIIDKLHSSNIALDEMGGESGFTGSIIDDFYSWNIQGDKRKLKVVLLEFSLMNFNLRISNKIKWNAKVVLLEV